MTFRLFTFAVIVGTTIWVGIDSSKLEMNRGRMGGGLLDMSVAGWIFCCLLLWIISFPCYLTIRGRYRRLNAAPFSYGVGAPGWGLPPDQYGGYGPTPYLPYPAAQDLYAPHMPPPQVSPDGRWWWDGQQWLPMPSSAAQVAAPNAWQPPTVAR